MPTPYSEKPSGIRQPTANHTMNSIFEELLLNNKLIQAASNGDTALVGNLLDQGADIHAACSCALRRATANGQTGTVALLLDRGADIHAVHDLALRSAVKGGDRETTALLLGRYKTSELQSLQDTRLTDLSGMDKLLPLVRMEIARRLVQKCIIDQPALEI
jgi:ankyrin repeat protein